MLRRLLSALAALGVAVTPAACGSDQSQSPTSAGRSGPELFAQACGACHTLSGHNDPRHQGGDLLSFQSTRRQMLQLAGEMPLRHPLTRSQLDAVVTFVMSMESRSR